MRRSIAAWSSVGLVVLLGLIGSGCTGTDEPTKPKTTVDPNAPPPPTPEEVAKKAITELGLDQPLPAPGARLSSNLRGTTVANFKTKHDELMTTPEGQGAAKIVQRTLEEKIAALEKGEYWEYVLTYADAYAVFQPDSKKYDRSKEKAMTQLRKPRVTVHGLPQANGHKMALLKFYIPLTSENFTETLSEGEEAHGVRFIGVFGNDRGVRLEYLETGERYVAYLKSQK